MTRKWKPMLLLVVGAMLVSARPAAAEKLTVKQILDRIDDLYQGKASRGELTMKVVTKHWTREMKLKFWSKDKDKSLFRVLAPKKSKGMATLKVKDNIWNYLPKVRRTIKVPSSMMGSSWMGSHFTNNDLVKMSRMADDYRSKISFEGKRGSVELIEITSMPRKDAAVVWGKLVITVRQGDLMPLTIRYYKENMKLARTMTFSEVKKLGGKTLPSTMTVVPADKPKEKTLIRYSDAAFDIDLSDKLFSLRSLRR